MALLQVLQCNDLEKKQAYDNVEDSVHFVIWVVLDVFCALKWLFTTNMGINFAAFFPTLDLFDGVHMTFTSFLSVAVLLLTLRVNGGNPCTNDALKFVRQDLLAEPSYKPCVTDSNVFPFDIVMYLTTFPTQSTRSPTAKQLQAFTNSTNCQKLFKRVQYRADEARPCTVAGVPYPSFAMMTLEEILATKVKDEPTSAPAPRNATNSTSSSIARSRRNMPESSSDRPITFPPHEIEVDTPRVMAPSTLAPPTAAPRFTTESPKSDVPVMSVVSYGFMALVAAAVTLLL
jgi:hypothetical protein